MKSFMIIGLLVLIGCSRDLEIIDDSLPVPVIYSIIDPYDSVNYVRVGKTFKIYSGVVGHPESRFSDVS